MTQEEIITILSGGYQPQSFQTYRKIYKQTFGNEAGRCGCVAQRVYNELKNYYKIK